MAFLGPLFGATSSVYLALFALLPPTQLIFFFLLQLFCTDFASLRTANSFFYSLSLYYAGKRNNTTRLKLQLQFQTCI